MTQTQWWRDAVIYQIYPRSFADSNGDGYGDLPGAISKLPYLKELGVDAVWLSPFYLSPMADAGYDVADYREVDPLFGQTADAKRLIDEAHALGIRVLIDLVPNHTSDAHEWFQAAVAAEPGAPERGRYLIRDGKGEDGELPPNNWKSLFGGPGWSRLQRPDGTWEQWYLHMFDVHQPDLDWDSELVREGFDDILRHWLDLGVDGFRVDVAHSLVKEAGLPDEVEQSQFMEGDMGPMWDQEGVHDIYRRWRKVLDSYDGDRAMVAEAWVPKPERLARYVRPDEMHQAFNFDFLSSAWDASSYRRVITTTMAANEAVGAPTTWVMSNHDVVRHASRLGRAETSNTEGISERDPQPDNELGLRRAKAATLMMLALPGSAYLYQGEELGLPEHTTVPDGVRQDPIWEGTKHQKVGRDGCRIPMPWVADAPGLGFGPSERTWLPQPESYRALAADQQVGVPGSTWTMYRDALRLRRQYGLGLGRLTWEDAPEHVVCFDNGEIRVMVNIGGDPVPLPEGEVLLASTELDGELPTDAAVWVHKPVD
ncbi:glycoside hydrolase family 13 protein [Arachnia propionica]|uniref:Glycoside hydrolase family 13 protein n=1 Tax=Arachnia propionica TaxID=1750 RepID=A0A3P1T2M5_9ACTN|nr:glycoside hydrolase family 13 protein [Arachnia propionica]RRD03711.1 glycoside hydrolase family 13 protein [Arachnia propionica]